MFLGKIHTSIAIALWAQSLWAQSLWALGLLWAGRNRLSSGVENWF
jgi:hypothetical protein